MKILSIFLFIFILFVLSICLENNRYADLEEKCRLMGDKCEFLGYIGEDRIKGNIRYVKGIKLKLNEK